MDNQSKTENQSKDVVDMVNRPEHYKHGTFEVIDEMIMVFGPEKVYDFCIMNTWKYRSRAPYKDNLEQDMAKADNYLSMARSIQQRNPDCFLQGCNLIKQGV